VVASSLVGVGYGGVYDVDEGFRHSASVKGARFERCPLMR
jgi:hypothetical protein